MSEKDVSSGQDAHEGMDGVSSFATHLLACNT